MSNEVLTPLPPCPLQHQPPQTSPAASYSRPPLCHPACCKPSLSVPSPDLPSITSSPLLATAVYHPLSSLKPFLCVPSLPLPTLLTSHSALACNTLTTACVPSYLVSSPQSLPSTRTSRHTPLLHPQPLPSSPAASCSQPPSPLPPSPTSLPFPSPPLHSHVPPHLPLFQLQPSPHDSLCVVLHRLFSPPSLLPVLPFLPSHPPHLPPHLQSPPHNSPCVVLPLCPLP